MGRRLVATCLVAGALRGACRSWAGRFLRVSLPSRQPLPVPRERADSQRRNHLGKIGPGKPCLPAPRALCVRHWAAVVQSLSHVLLFATSSAVAHQAPPSSSVSGSLLKFTSIKLVMSSSPHPLWPSPLRLNPFSMLSIPFLLIFLHRNSQVTERVVANVLVFPLCDMMILEQLKNVCRP